ncbi:putative recombination initiation defect 1 [Arabidopsis thaliana]|uniref:Protein PUTATIVE RECOMBINATION INITIATION DEFECT 1 n=2 Tax=Arabidopsis thaliana TaxID=3702 RepID=PRD1_ARATH|nr:putative recombination initiation defect 1 [Arabidopsis thaliana]O23277.3 RecName: Full=Protein PUTATIVE RECOMBINATION INITIATION DEFECT 1; Short=AtPRD1; Short=Protein PRD1 [Arabidopsis thaliana]AEE83390.2 putative recombination initiation defect 1 [Arabidopsis thaliana]OAO99463.1 PRD1 [Arabidopsis thaliana]|eukprot:NP_001319933.1 putative recombination initiation defect 1 [Arabidopsis thaliana]
MFFQHSQLQNSDHLLHESMADSNHQSLSPPCANGHRSTISLRDDQGGTFCLICFSNLVSDPRIPTVHVSYALHQLSIAISEPIFLRTLLSSHIHFLVSPLVHALSSIDDAPIAIQIMDMISLLCSVEESSIGEDFVERISDQLSSGALGWSRRQLHMLHCFGVLMSCENININSHIRDKEALVCQLVEGLQLPSEEIRGEILFALYKFSALQFTEQNVDGIEVLSLLCPKLLCLSLEALAKTQRDDVRLNCVALLTILAQQGLLANSHSNSASSMSLDEVDDDPMQTAENVAARPCLNVLFAEAIKGPLLSTDSEVQIKTLDLIFHYISQESTPSKQIQVMVEENVADYIFEILRLSECKDQVVNSCLRVLDLFSLAEHSFRKRLVIGFPSVIRVLHYVGEVPCHPFQIQTLKLISSCISDFPGIASSSQVQEIALVLKKMLERYYSQEMGLFPDAFAIICSVFVSLMKTPSFGETADVLTSLQESLRHSILASLSLPEKDSTQILHAVYLLNEVYVYCTASTSINKTICIELRHCVIDVCTSHLLPWFLSDVNEVNEEATLGIMETFHSILLQNSDIQAKEFAELLVSADWFSFSFGCLGNFCTDNMKQRIYLMLSSLVDILLEQKTGSHIRDALHCLPSDPQDLLFLLGQASSNNQELASCQSAALLIFHTSSIYNDRLADDKLVLASLEQYIILNKTSLICAISDSPALLNLVNLYGLCRSLQNERYQISYSLEAERIIFHLLNEYEWDLGSINIHLESLKWLFQQESISKSLIYQIQKISRNNLIGNEVHNVYGDGRQRSLTYWFAKLISEGDNYAATLLVNLLTQLAEKEEQENDVISILNLMNTIVSIFPTASNNLSMNGIGSVIHRLVSGFSNSSLGTSFRTLLLLVFNILTSVQPAVLMIDESWYAVSIKLLNFLSLRDTAIKQNHEDMVVIGILSLVLYHSSDGALVEASRNIVSNSYLVSAINTVVDVACSKGPALTQCQDETNIGEALAFTLLLYFFSLRSLQIVLAGAVDWQTFFGTSTSLETLPVVCIHCHNLCRLMHFGAPQIKLIASYCLLELLTGLSEQVDIKKEQLQCSSSYLKSMKAVLGGLVFCDDIRVATNSALCLSMILGWEDMEGRTEMLKTSSWYRFIAEEMSVSLAMPCSASSTYVNHHKPAVYLTVAMLRLKNKPVWLRTVFDESCISSMIQNLNGINISREIVILFRELMQAELLNSQQVTKLDRAFQECRKQMHRNGTRDETVEEQVQRKIPSIHDHSEFCNYLVHLMVSNSFGHPSESETYTQKKKQILDEMEQFSELISTREGRVSPIQEETRQMQTERIV